MSFACQHQGNPGPVTTWHDTEAEAVAEAERLRAGSRDDFKVVVFEVGELIA